MSVFVHAREQMAVFMCVRVSVRVCVHACVCARVHPHIVHCACVHTAEIKYEIHAILLSGFFYLALAVDITNKQGLSNKDFSTWHPVLYSMANRVESAEERDKILKRRKSDKELII